MAHDVKVAGLKKVPKEKHNFVVVRDRGFLPSISLNEKQLKEIKLWDVGKNYKIVLEVKQTSKNQREGEPISASFDVTKIKALGGTDNVSLAKRK